MTNLFIPSKIRIGFQNRDDTFTGKLAYIIFYDANGQIKQEKNWNNWRDKNLPYVEFENTPRSGYIFNKGVQRHGYWGSGRSVIRVYDPRDFEFEISIDNLIGLLMHSDVSKRDIVEECVFAWPENSNNVILLPVNSDEYQKGLQHTKKQSKNINAEELIPGQSYSHKKDEEIYTYIGKYNYFEKQYWNDVIVSKGKHHVFYDGKEFVIPSVEKLSECISTETHSDFANLVEQFFNSINGKEIGKFTYGVPKPNKDTYYKSLNGFNIKIKVNIKNGIIDLYDIKLSQFQESLNKKKLIDVDYRKQWNEYGFERLMEKEIKEFTEIFRSKFKDTKTIPVGEFLTVLKEMNYKTAYYVDELKNKTEL